MVGRKERFVGQESEFGLLEEGGRFSISWLQYKKLLEIRNLLGRVILCPKAMSVSNK